MSNKEEVSNDVGTQVLFENDKVKVWNLILKPGEASPIHFHKYPCVIVHLEGLELQYNSRNDPGFGEGVDESQGLLDDSQRNAPYGTVQNRMYQFGEANYRLPDKHYVVNNGNETYKNIIVEIKDD